MIVPRHYPVGKGTRTSLLLTSSSSSLPLRSLPSDVVSTSIHQLPSQTLQQQQQYRMIGTTTTTTTFHSEQHKQRPNRFTTIYNEMQDTCPNEIELYASCVIAAQQQQQQTQQQQSADSTTTTSNNSGSTYHSCSTEFAAVKECFRTVRRRQQTISK